MRKNNSNWFLLTPLAIAVAVFFFFQFFYAYHLFFKEQIQLFLYTPDYLLTYFEKPAWLARLSGDFLTQFFYLRGGGPLVLALLFSAEWLLLRLLIQKNSSKDGAGWWALIPVATDFTLHLLLSHNLADSMGLLIVLFAFHLLTVVKNKTLNTFLAIILAIAGHWFVGNAILLLPFFLLLRKKQAKPIIAFLCLAIVLAVPILTRSVYLTTFQQAYYLPAFSSKSFLLPGSVLFVFLLGRILMQKSTTALFVKPLAVVLTVTIVISGLSLNADFGYEKILALDSETYFGNRDKVLSLAEKEPLENRLATYYTNMALAQKGELPERLLAFYQPSIYGLILPVSQYERWQTILFSNELFYLLGDMNLAQHSAMLANTFSPYNRSSRMVKRLAEINMITKDYSGAEKYLRMLEFTLFHKKWAQKRLDENNKDSNKIWLVKKRNQTANTDIIRTAFDYINSIEFLVQQNPDNQIALDYLLSYHLLNKDLVAFKLAYDRYAKLEGAAAQKIYAEALLVILFRENAPEQEFEEYGINPKQLNNFINYTEKFEKADGDLNVLQSSFGETYWFYYHFASMEGGEK